MLLGYRIFFLAEVMLMAILYLPAQTNISPTNTNAPTKLFQENHWVLSYGLGYGGIGSLYYASGFNRDLFYTSHILLHTLTSTIAVDYFFEEFFDIGADITMGGNLNSKIPISSEQIYGGRTRIFFLMVGLRGLVHYPFSIADVYGGITIGLGLTHQNFIPNNESTDRSENHLFLGWMFKFGSRFKITDRQGLYAELSFPLPWISIGGYYRIQ